MSLKVSLTMTDRNRSAGNSTGKRPRLRERIRFSLVLRLNASTTLRTLSMLISLNLLLLVLAVTAVFLHLENQAGRTVLSIREETRPEARTLLPELLSDANAFEISIERFGDTWKATESKEDLSASPLLTFFHLDGLALSAEVQRSFPPSGTPAGAPLAERAAGLAYRLQYPLAEVNGVVYTVVSVTVPLFPVLLRLGALFAVLLVFEILLLLGSIPAGARSARRVLRPIDEMARITRNINASRLDTRLNLKGSQNELKDLAGTINEMLERIDTAYRSQIRFVSDASHELRTPIAVIQGYANLLDRWGKNDPQTLQESIAALKTESENMKELVEKLLFLARGDNNTLTLHMESIPLDRLVREIARETAMIDPNHIFRISREDPVAVTADAQLLKQAIRILIDNSIKYTPPGGEITIGCTGGAGSEVRLLVQDSGAGIPAVDVPYIFDRFYRADSSRTRKTGGTGLGLSIAKWIVERHSGRIEVLSREGYGTRMSVILPRLENTERPARNAAGSPDAAGIAAAGGTEVREHPVPPGLLH